MANEKRLDLIDRNVLLDKYWQMLDDGIVTLQDVRYAIENAPTVDAVEVVHGRWVKGNWSVTCSICGSLSIAHDGKNYCPCCGAKMDGGNEDG